MHFTIWYIPTLFLYLLFFQSENLTEYDLRTLFGEKLSGANIFVQLNAAQNDKVENDIVCNTV